MTEQEALDKMIAPGTPRPGKWRSGVIQILVTSSCNLSCFGCTQGSQLRRKHWEMTPEHFEEAVISLAGYFGVYGTFGGNPAVSRYFEDYCRILQKHVPFAQRGLWCNDPMGKGKIMRETFNPSVSNLNVHLDQNAYAEFKRDWPESMPCGLTKDSRHSPPFVAMQDVIEDEEERWNLISNCDINQHWSAMIGVFRGELRAYFCEIAGAQAILHQYNPGYPDLGMSVSPGWWRKPMQDFAAQVRHHCHACGVPLRGRGELAQESDHRGTEQVSRTHEGVYKPKRKDRPVQVVTSREELGVPLVLMTDYIGNSQR